uniref:Galectin n=1 Tax=Globodera pallida TaxID=36090 RepID=A0A183CDI1_GLOPA
MATDLWIWRRQTVKMPQQSFEVSLPHKRPQNGYPTTQVLRIEGILLESAQKFDLLLKNGYTGQVYFRFDPLFNRRFIPRRNNRTDVINQQGDLPFTSGKPFSLDLESDGTIITIRMHMRGEEIYEFVAHDNLKQVTSFECNGDILVHDARRETPLIPLPYLRPLQGFTPPETIKVVGSAYDGPKKRFEVNLRTAEGEYLFSFLVDFARNQVVRDSTKGKVWQIQEVDGGFPFQLGKFFTIDIIADGKLLKMRVDGQPFCEFLPREGDDMNNVSILEVTGEVCLNSVTFFPEEKLKLPYETQIDGGFTPDKRLRIVGTPKFGRGSFEVRFIIDEKNVLLDYQPYFETYKHYVARWVMQEGIWRMLESDGGFPFEQGRQFELDFRAKDKLIEVYVDGRRHCEFVPKDEVSKVTKVSILPADSMQLNTVVVGDVDIEAMKTADRTVQKEGTT